MKKVVEEQKIWNEEEKVVKSGEDTKKLAPLRFYRQIHVFEKKASKRILVKKIWNYTIELKKRFILEKKKIYLLSREEKGEIYEFINKQLRKGYIRLLKLPQTALVFFIGKKNSKKRMVQDYRYLNK